MSSMLYVIFRAADHGVHDIHFTSEECATAYYEMVAQDPANRYKYYCKAVDMGFMSASNCTKHAPNCTETTRK